MEKWQKMSWFSLIIFLFSINTFANWDFRGHHREIGSIYYEKDKNSPFFSQLVHNTRLKALYSKDNLSYELAYDLFYSYNFYENPVLQEQLQNTNFNYRLDDFDIYLTKKNLKNESHLLLQNLDRLNASYQYQNVKSTIGRQAIGLGTARFINPLDILVPFDLVMINLEERLGVDAIRLTMNLGDLSDVEVISVFNEDKKNLNLLTFSNNFNEIDYKLYLINKKKFNIYGLDVQGSLWDLGLWLELGYFQIDNEIEFSRYSLGANYFFKNELNLILEYHYNGAGTKYASNYQINFAQSFQKELGIFLKGIDYLNLLISYPISPLKNLGLNMFSNLNDESILLIPSFDYNIYENWYLNLSAFIGISSSNELAEFFNYPKIYTSSLKYFF